MLDRYGEKMTLGKGTKLYCEGQKVDFYCYVVVRGQVRILGDRGGVYQDFERPRARGGEEEHRGVLDGIDKKRYGFLFVKGEGVE